MRLDSNQLITEATGLTEKYRGASPQRASAPALQVAIVTMTRARTLSEANWLRHSLRALTKTGLRIFVGDGGSSEEFTQTIGRLPRVQLCPLSATCKLTLVNQLRSAFTYAQAANPDYLLYTEPDKRSFFTRGLPLLLGTPLSPTQTRPGVVLAARTPRAFATFPKGQQIAESFMNRLCSEAFGDAGDYTYGPMLISNRLLHHVPHIPENLGWGWRFFLMAVAHQLRMPLTLCTVPTQCPRAQRNEDDSDARDYRLRQLQENVTGLANGWTCLLDQPIDPLPPLVVAA